MRKDLKEKINSLWRSTKKDLDKIIKDTTQLARKGEEYIKDISEKGKKRLEYLSLFLQREKLYYQLGKKISSTSSHRWGKDKKIEEILKKIRKINRKIKKS